MKEAKEVVISRYVCDVEERATDRWNNSPDFALSFDDSDVQKSVVSISSI